MIFDIWINNPARLKAKSKLDIWFISNKTSWIYSPGTVTAEQEVLLPAHGVHVCTMHTRVHMFPPMHTARVYNVRLVCVIQCERVQLEAVQFVPNFKHDLHSQCNVLKRWQGKRDSQDAALETQFLWWIAWSHWITNCSLPPSPDSPPPTAQKFFCACQNLLKPLS